MAARVGLERRRCMPARCGHCSTCASDQMLRRIIPTAERTVTRGGDKKLGKSFYERLCKTVGCIHMSGLYARLLWPLALMISAD